MSVVTFESAINLQFDLEEYDSRADVLDAILRIRYTPGDTTLMYKALEFVRKYSFKNFSGDRPDAKDILVVITCNRFKERNQTLVEAELLRKSNISSIILGIGNGVDSDELHEIASDDSNVFRVPDFNIIICIHNLINNLPC